MPAYVKTENINGKTMYYPVIDDNTPLSLDMVNGEPVFKYYDTAEEAENVCDQYMTLEVNAGLPNYFWDPLSTQWVNDTFV